MSGGTITGKLKRRRIDAAAARLWIVPLAVFLTLVFAFSPSRATPLKDVLSCHCTSCDSGCCLKSDSSPSGGEKSAVVANVAVFKDLAQSQLHCFAPSLGLTQVVLPPSTPAVVLDPFSAPIYLRFLAQLI